MRFHLLCATLAALLVAGCQSNPVVSETDTAPIDSPTATLEVKGLSCPQCAVNIDKQLLDVPGVAGVSTDLGAGIIKLELDPAAPPTRAQLARAVEDSGFTLSGITVP